MGLGLENRYRDNDQERYLPTTNGLQLGRISNVLVPPDEHQFKMGFFSSSELPILLSQPKTDFEGQYFSGTGMVFQTKVRHEFGTSDAVSLVLFEPAQIQRTNDVGDTPCIRIVTFFNNGFGYQAYETQSDLTGSTKLPLKELYSMCGFSWGKEQKRWRYSADTIFHWLSMGEDQTKVFKTLVNNIVQKVESDSRNARIEYPIQPFANKLRVDLKNILLACLQEQRPKGFSSRVQRTISLLSDDEIDSLAAAYSIQTPSIIRHTRITPRPTPTTPDLQTQPTQSDNEETSIILMHDVTKVLNQSLEAISYTAQQNLNGMRLLTYVYDRSNVMTIKPNDKYDQHPNSDNPLESITLDAQQGRLLLIELQLAHNTLKLMADPVTGGLWVYNRILKDTEQVNDPAVLTALKQLLTPLHTRIGLYLGSTQPGTDPTARKLQEMITQFNSSSHQ